MTLLGWTGRTRATVAPLQALALVVAVALVLSVTAGAARAETGAGEVACGYDVVEWPGAFTAHIRLTNHGPDLDGWQMVLTFGIPTELGSAWGAEMAQPDPYTMTAQNMFYNGTIRSGSAVIFGWIAFSSSHQLPDLTVNGAPCEVSVIG